MKKKMFIILPLATLVFCGGVCATNYQVKADMLYETEVGEEEPSEEVVIVEEPVEEQQVEEESKIDWEKIKGDLDKVQSYIDKVKEQQILGTTVGALLGTLVSLLFAYVFKRIGNKNIEDACAVARDSKEKLEMCSGDMKEMLSNAEEMIKEVKKANENNEEMTKLLDYSLKTIKELKEKNECAEREIANLKEVVLKIAYSNKDLIKSGVASELHEKYSNKE